MVSELVWREDWFCILGCSVCRGRLGDFFGGVFCLVGGGWVGLFVGVLGFFAGGVFFVVLRYSAVIEVLQRLVTSQVEAPVLFGNLYYSR